MLNRRLSLLAFSTALLFASIVKADIVVAIPPGTVLSGGSVSAQAQFAISNGSVQITLENLQADPTDVAQNLSDLAFAFSSGQTAGTLLSSSGQERAVSSNGTYSDGPTVATGWALENSFALTSWTGLRLHLLGTPTAPIHTIIGPPDGSGVYSSANGSIAGNSAHNPFLAGPVTFDVEVPGLISTDYLAAVRFSFGTTEGTFFETTVPPPEVPEPGSLSLFGGIGVVLLLSRKIRFR